MAVLLSARLSSASLVFDATESLSGTGIGAVSTVLTVQATPSESGCVAWNGSADVVGAAACPGGSGIAGGNEKTGANQTLTRTVGSLSLTNAADLRVVFNATETDSSITIQELIVTIFSPAGAVLFTSGPLTGKPVAFPNTNPGVGSSGFVFKLDAAQVTAANAATAFSNVNNRIGLAAALTGSSSGNETFFLAKFTTVGPTEADLGVTKTAPATVEAGATFTYTVTVTNFGPANATAVTLVDTLPAGVTFNSATPSQGSCLEAAGTVTCALGALAANTAATVDISVTATAAAGTTLLNTADVSGTPAETSNLSNNHAEAITVIGSSAVPTLSEWGMILLTALLVGLGVRRIRAHQTGGGLGRRPA